MVFVVARGRDRGSSSSGQRAGPPLVRRRQDDEEQSVDDDVPEQLRNIEPAMIERIENEIMDSGDPVSFDDIGA